MRYRLVVALIVMAGLIPISAFSQAKMLRTPDGQPDLQGIWSFATITPLERPAELAGRSSLRRRKQPITSRKYSNAITWTDVMVRRKRMCGEPTTISGGIAEPESSRRAARRSE